MKLPFVIPIIHILFFYCEGFILKNGCLKLLPLPGAINKTKLPHYAHNGLLSGFSNISNQKYYSSSIPCNQALEVVSNERLLFDIVESDCESDPDRIEIYLKNIIDKMSIFMEKNNVWNRDDLFRALDNICGAKGNLACVLGGKSTGKSLVLGEFSRKNLNNRRVIYVDMRSGFSSITNGFIDVINEGKNEDFKAIMLKFLQTVKLKVTNQLEIDFNPFLDVIPKDQENKLLEKLLKELAKNFPKEFITLVVDEANLPLTINDDTSESEVKQVKASLALLTRLTKQEKMINVILVSSEHVFPFRLANTKLGFNIQDINKFIFAGEVPPNEMFRLLTKEWNLTDNLAVSLISIYGGHIWDVYLALVRLEELKADFFPFDANRSANIAKCFKEDVEKEKLITTLKTLAETGFVAIQDRDDPIAEVISKHNVGGVVVKSVLNVGLPKNVWVDKCKYGLVPSFQSTRLLIAEYLFNNNL